MSAVRSLQVRVAAALSRIAAQAEQSFDGGEERVNNWDKARREKERKEEGEKLSCPLCCVTAALLSECPWTRQGV